MIDKGFFPLSVKPETDGFSKSVGIPGSSPTSPLLGRFLCAGPVELGSMDGGSNQSIKLNYTGPPGSATGIYFALVSFLGNNGFTVRKVDEWISVTPEHQQYYNMVVEQKRQLEGVIKSGLMSASQAVADASLVEHDLRKYKEILNYFKEGISKDSKKGNEHSLRAMFIDQVDVHTGDGISLRSIVQRWPTIIADFMKLTSEDDTIEKVEARLKGISKAEAVILTTKNKLFIEWESIFKGAAMDRYNQLKSLNESKKKTVEEYRKWILPYLGRFKSMKLGHESTDSILESTKTPYELAGQASFMNGITLWVWKAYMPAEFRKPSTESIYNVPIDDKFVVDNFIKNDKIGLANKSFYPQLKYIQKDPKTGENLIDAKTGKELTEADVLIKEVVNKWKDGLSKDSLYYIFFEINIERTGGKMPGYEFEDITFTIKTYMLSQNIMLVKQLELKLREKEIEKYFNEILGIQKENMVETDYPDLAGKEEEKKEEPAFKIDLGLKKYTEGIGKSFKQMDVFFSSIVKGVGKLFAGLKLPLMFSKKGDYVRDFNDTVVQFFMIPMGGEAFGPVKGFIMDQMGVG